MRRMCRMCCITVHGRYLSQHSFIHSFIHYGNLYSASSRLLLRSAPDPCTAKVNSFEARVECVECVECVVLPCMDVILVSIHSFIHSFIHYGNLYSASSRLLLRSAPDPCTAKVNSFEARVECVECVECVVLPCMDVILVSIHSFIHSFIHYGNLYSASSRLLLRSAPDPCTAKVNSFEARVECVECVECVVLPCMDVILVSIHSFIHSFIHYGNLYSASSRLLLRSAPDPCTAKVNSFEARVECVECVECVVLPCMDVILVSIHSFIHSFIHYGNLYSASSRLLLRSAPDPCTAKVNSFEARVECVECVECVVLPCMDVILVSIHSFIHSFIHYGNLYSASSRLLLRSAPDPCTAKVNSFEARVECVECVECVVLPCMDVILVSIHSFIHSFITEIYTAPRQGYYSEALPIPARLK